MCSQIRKNSSSPLYKGEEEFFLAQLINVLLQDTIRCCPSSRNPISEVSSPSQVFSFWAPHHQNTPLSQSVKSTPPRFNGRFPSHPHLRHRWGKNSVFSSGCSWWALDCYSTKVLSFKMTPHVCTRTCAPSRTCGIVQNKIVQLVKETFLIPLGLRPRSNRQNNENERGLEGARRATGMTSIYSWLSVAKPLKKKICYAIIPHSTRPTASFQSSVKS